MVVTKYSSLLAFLATTSFAFAAGSRSLLQTVITPAENYNPTSLYVNSTEDILAVPVTVSAPYSQSAYQCNVSGDSRLPTGATGTFPLNLTVTEGQVVRVVFVNGNLLGFGSTTVGETGVDTLSPGVFTISSSGGLSPVVQQPGSALSLLSTSSGGATSTSSGSDSSSSSGSSGTSSTSSGTSSSSGSDTDTSGTTDSTGSDSGTDTSGDTSGDSSGTSSSTGTDGSDGTSGSSPAAGPDSSGTSGGPAAGPDTGNGTSGTSGGPAAGPGTGNGTSGTSGGPASGPDTSGSTTSGPATSTAVPNSPPGEAPAPGSPNYCAEPGNSVLAICLGVDTNVGGTGTTSPSGSVDCSLAANALLAVCLGATVDAGTPGVSVGTNGAVSVLGPTVGTDVNTGATVGTGGVTVGTPIATATATTTPTAIDCTLAVNVGLPICVAAAAAVAASGANAAAGVSVGSPPPVVATNVGVSAATSSITPIAVGGRKLLQNTVPGGPNNGVLLYVGLVKNSTVSGFYVPETDFGIPYVEFNTTGLVAGTTATFNGVLQAAQVNNGVPVFPFQPSSSLSPGCQVTVNFAVAS